MTFIVFVEDFKTQDAFERRMEVRENHLSLFKEMLEKGVFKYGAGLINDSGQLCGSMIVCEFNSRYELENEWLKKEPYFLNKVWEKIDIKPCVVPQFLDK